LPSKRSWLVFFSKEDVLNKYKSFSVLIEGRSSTQKPEYLDDFVKQANILRGQRVLESSGDWH
jgi:hypothetical protein